MQAPDSVSGVNSPERLSRGLLIGSRRVGNLVRASARAGSTPADASKPLWYLIGDFGPFLTMSHPAGPFLHVGVAQWTEQESPNLPVAGSNPSVGSIIAG